MFVHGIVIPVTLPTNKRVPHNGMYFKLRCEALLKAKNLQFTPTHFLISRCRESESYDNVRA